MERTIDIDDDLTALNPWVRHSIALFHRKHYLDNINKVYPLQIAAPERIDGVLRRRIIMAHQARRTGELITILKGLEKFPYDEPLWFLIKGIRGCEKNNPGQIRRISKSLYAMTADETIIRLESAPKLNTQMGPMFNSWLNKDI